MARARFGDDDFLDAALAIAAERGPAAITVGSITDRLKAPTGSFYHRFASRDVLLGRLWLRLAADFHEGVSAALEAGDPLRAALHTLVWARERPDAARTLLLFHHRDFVQGPWPEGLKEARAAQAQQTRTAVAIFARLAFGHVDPDALRRAEFVMREMPVAAVSQHLRRREAPPPIVDKLIATAYRAIAETDTEAK